MTLKVNLFSSAPNYIIIILFLTSKGCQKWQPLLFVFKLLSTFVISIYQAFFPL